MPNLNVVLSDNSNKEHDITKINRKAIDKNLDSKILDSFAKRSIDISEIQVKNNHQAIQKPSIVIV